MGIDLNIPKPDQSIALWRVGNPTAPAQPVTGPAPTSPVKLEVTAISWGQTNW